MTDRRTFLSASGPLALSACATPPLGSSEATQVPAPRWSIGESWTYRRIDAYNGLDRGVITRAAEPVTEKGIRLVTRQGRRGEQQRPRTDSSQSRYYLTASARVEGWEEVLIGGRAHRAIIVRRTLRLGPTPAHDGNLHREELEWYVPELRAGARLRIFEWEDFVNHITPGYRLNVQLE